MDRLVLDTETKKEPAKVSIEKKEEKKVVLKKEKLKQQVVSVTFSEEKPKETEPLKEMPAVEQEESVNQYVSSFEIMTIEDIKKEQSQKEVVQEEIEDKIENEESAPVEETEEEIEKEPEKPVKKLVIERPNYDFIKENKKAKKEKKKPKLKTVAVACALAVATIGTVAGSVAVDNLYSSYIELQDEYTLNLLQYLKNINNLNATNGSLDFLETYPEDLTSPSNIGESTNWFDNLANFIAGIFGG